MSVQQWVRASLPGVESLNDSTWRRRHQLLQVVLVVHLPALLVVGWVAGAPLGWVAAGLVPALAALAAGRLVRRRRSAAVAVTAGLAWCSVLLVAAVSGAPESGYHVFALIGFVALYRDRAPLVVLVGLTAVGRGAGLVLLPAAFSAGGSAAGGWLDLALLVGAMLVATAGVLLFGRLAANEQAARGHLERDLARADAEIDRRRFTSDLLVNLARRSQALLQRQLDVIAELERLEQRPATVRGLRVLDHLAKRIRRNAENLRVLAGASTPRVWAQPVALRDVLQAAIVETEQPHRVDIVVDDRLAMVGNSVADLTHLVAELVENADRLSPPDSTIGLRVRPRPADAGGCVLTVEDTGVGMDDEQVRAANAVLAEPGEVDLSTVSARLGLHVVGRLAQRHGISVSLSAAGASGLTAIVLLPESLFVRDWQPGSATTARPGPGAGGRAPAARLDGSALRSMVALGPRVETPGRHAPPEWRQWWDSSRATPPRPAPEQRSDGGADDAAGPAASRRELRRRTPMAELAPQLRDAGPGSTPPTDTAARALARYQAGRGTLTTVPSPTKRDPSGPRAEGAAADDRSLGGPS